MSAPNPGLTFIIPLISFQEWSFTPYNVIYIFLFFWISSFLLDIVLWRLVKEYKINKLEVRRNIVTYILEIVVGTALMIWIAVLFNLISTKGEYTLYRFQQSTFVALVLLVLYLYEMLYREGLRWQILIHHCVTISIVLIGIQRVEASSEVWIVEVLLLLSLTAFTEQPIHIGLLMYRLGFRKFVAELFFFSSIQNAVIKFMLHIWCIVIWAKNVKHGDPSFRVIFIILEALLIFVQIYASYVQWQLAVRVKINIQKMNEEDEKNKLDVEIVKNQQLSVKSKYSYLDEVSLPKAYTNQRMQVAKRAKDFSMTLDEINIGSTFVYPNKDAGIDLKTITTEKRV